MKNILCIMYVWIQILKRNGYCMRLQHFFLALLCYWLNVDKKVISQYTTFKINKVSIINSLLYFHWQVAAFVRKPGFWKSEGFRKKWCNSYQRDTLVWQSIIILAILSGFVYTYRRNNTYATLENPGLFVHPHSVGS